MFNEKLAYLKKKIASGESAPLWSPEPKDPHSRDQKDPGTESKLLRKLPRLPPARKIVFTADDLKVGDMVLVHLPTKKGNYLGEVRRVWLPVKEAPGETEKWIRIQLWGRTSPKASTFAPWWIDGRKRCFQKKASHHGELWEDVYASWVRYRLLFPLEGGALHPKDVAEIHTLWGPSLEIQ